MELPNPKLRKRIIEKSVVIYLSVLLFALFFISWTGYIYHLNFREALVKQWKQQLSSTLDLAALRVENFYAKFAANLVTVSHNPVIKQRVCDKMQDVPPEWNYCPLSDLYELHKSEIDAIILQDTSGAVLRQFPVYTMDSMLDASFSNWLEIEHELSQDEVYVSPSFKNQFGKDAFSISTSVFMDSAMAGVLRWIVSYERLARNYIQVVRMSDNACLCLCDGADILQYHPDTSWQQKSLWANLDGASFKVFEPNGRLIPLQQPIHEFISNQPEESFIYSLPGKDEQLVLFHKLMMHNQSWNLILSIPLKTITSPIRRHALTTFWMEVLIFLLFALFAYIFYLTQKRKSHFEIEARYQGELAESSRLLHLERLQRLNATIDGQESERNRIARELHDSLGQYLLALKVKILGLSQESNPDLNTRLEPITQLAGTAIDEVKRISENLMPRTLDEFGLYTATSRLCEQASRDSGIVVDFVSYGMVPSAEQKFKTHLYRIVQEALSNAIKHSKARHIDVQLLGNPQQFSLIIQDDGVGFDVSRVDSSQGNGLHNIMDRVRIMEGEVELLSSPGEGTLIRIKVFSKSWLQNENS